ncbi:MAG TPA: substrate-binding domain-containing protein, partial [Rhodanobacteraceae bacterium]|nr:substrate-binding domain-containing protein [Rhodanobacteraceae bacterium]
MLSRLLHPVFAVALSLCIGASFDAVAATKHSSHHSKSSHKKASGPALVIRGDLTTSRALVDDIAEVYEDAGRGRIEVQPFNTISGIDAALNGSADIAASARPGFPGRAQESGLTFTPVAWDALVIITSPDNPVSNITLKQLHDVYYGDITNWQQLGGRNEPIDLYSVASPLDGAEYSLRRLLYGNGDARVAAPRLYINVGTLEQGVALDPKAMGLSTLSGVHDNKQVKIIPVEGVTPTTDTVANGSYPLYTTIYLASSPASPHAVDIAKFMDFLNTDQAKKLMRTHDLLPYADAPTLSAQTTDQQVAAV